MDHRHQVRHGELRGATVTKGEAPGPQGGRRTTSAVAATGARTRKLLVWVSEGESEEIRDLANAHGTTMSDWVRRRATTTGAAR
jgi:hypothetical protein